MDVTKSADTVWQDLDCTVKLTVVPNDYVMVTVWKPPTKAQLREARRKGKSVIDYRYTKVRLDDGAES